MFFIRKTAPFSAYMLNIKVSLIIFVCKLKTAKNNDIMYLIRYNYTI